ncbi:hypothetical protein GCM10019016_030710 [Streptomyces prasinosporus]|uniref:Uncharacterized protein n=1 Tax=Streptomyces prasinosporus TaxID=68256 RepID=A0ABP6TL50_9ACTN
MDIIPGKLHGEPMSLRRMPADATGKTGFCQPGGVMASMADGMEEEILEAAREDLQRLKKVLEEDLSKHDLVLAAGFLFQSARAVLDVAECRGERLA